MKKRLLAICLLSALIFPMGITSSAEEDTGQETSVVGVSKPSDVGDTATSNKDTEQTSEDGIPTTGTIEESEDGVVGVSEVSDEISNTSEVSDEVSTTSEVSEETSTEVSDEISTVSEVSEDEVSEETSTEPETSEWQPPFEGEQDIYFTLNFGGHFGHSPYDYEDGYIDYSSVHFQVLTADKQTVLGDYQITEDMFDTPRGRSTTPVLTARVPEWKDGVKYYLRVEGLPSIYTSSMQDIEIKCEKQRIYELSFPDGEPSKDKNGVVITPKPTRIDTGRYYYFGVDVVSALTITPQLKDFDTLCYVYDNDKNPVSNMVLSVVGVNSDDVVVYNQQAQVIDGIACIKIANDKVEKIKLSSDTIVNDKQLNGEFEFAYNYATASSYSPIICKLYTNKVATQEELQKEIDGTIVNEYQVGFNLKYADKNDMTFFEKSQINLSVYSGAILERDIILDEDGAHTYNVLEGKHTIKSVRNTDYDVVISPVTLDVKKGAKVDITATPRVTLTIINAENGVKKQAHFKIEDIEFTDIEHKFSVNTGKYVSVINLDTDEDFTVYVGKFKDITLNIASGDIETVGVLDNDTTTSTSTNNKPNDTVTVVPKTGDIIFGVLLTLCGLTGLSYLGYLYFKKKGENSK